MSSSLLTNMSALSALQSLSMTQKSLATVQSQISTGLRVQSASDNAAYWSISTTMKSDTGALSSVTDALSLGASTVSVATSALTSSISVMNAIKQDLVTAAEPGVDLTKVQSDISAQQAQLRSIANSASFNGQNFLSANSTNSNYVQTANIVASFSRDATGAISVGTIGVDTSTINLYDPAAAGGATPGVSNTTATGILDKVDTSNTYTTGGTGVSIDSLDITAAGANITALTKQVDAAISSMTAAAATLGATTTRINLQTSFVSALSTAITEGVGSLVDADMNEASTRLNALQTQQQLGIQSLGIANQNSQLILKLFGG
jgi:flagellin